MSGWTRSLYVVVFTCRSLEAAAFDELEPESDDMTGNLPHLQYLPQ